MKFSSFSFHATATAGKFVQRLASVNLDVPSRLYEAVIKYLSAIVILVLAKKNCKLTRDGTGTPRTVTLF
jgi:prolipoprotein diacylglyceryltransferase